MRHLWKSLALALGLLTTLPMFSEEKTIRISTDGTDLIYKVNGDGRLCQSYFGHRLHHDGDISFLRHGEEGFAVYGQDNFFHPAFKVTHADGNMSLRMDYISHHVSQVDNNVTTTDIILKDEVYPFWVTIHYTAFQEEEIHLIEPDEYASSMLHFNAGSYWLTEFAGNWADEAHMTERRLDFGKKMIDTNLGARANMYCAPMFILGLDSPMDENHGDVMLGTMAWSGNFRFTFEVDEKNGLRIISGINPFGAEYRLDKKDIFRTPEFIFTLSDNGAGKAARSFHDWARCYRIKDGNGGRLSLLNNWEATGFNFDEEKLKAIIPDAKKLGVDMFLLDDGWFANKYPRNNDNAGLGDWSVNTEKLPDGINALIKAAYDSGVKFGLWIEPEMVNPKSELYERHKDWVLRFPNREEKYFRNQLVLDLSNPEVQDFIFDTVNGIMQENPGIAYFKWDCNSPICNAYSAYEGQNQSHLWTDYVKGLYNVLERVSEKYPDLPMMLCAGGGGRTDYGALKYFTEFWASDNTDPIERLYIQWGYSYFFPMKAMCAHVTNWNRDAGIKFRTDVAMMCKFGFDIIVNDLSADELEFCQKAIADHDRLRPAIFEGDFYRLHSPYGSQHAAVQSVSKDKKSSVVFAYDINPRFGEINAPVKLCGLDPEKLYRINEINIMPAGSPSAGFNEAVISGEYLMNAGLELFSTNRLHSVVLELTAVK